MTTAATHWTLTVEGAAPDPIMLTDGTLWSHAATLGTWFYRGEPITIDRAKIESYIRNFATGYPKKVPVDYEHGSGTETYDGSAPKAGDVLELRGVYSAADFTGDLKAAADKLAKKSGRTLDDPSSYGLWMRWRPTARALNLVKNGELTEHSIEFHDDYTSPLTGKSQGPTLLAVALTNRPFLDGMIPIAASRDDGEGRTAPTPPNREHTMSTNNVRLFSALSAVLPAAVTDEDQAVTALTAAAPEIQRSRSFARDVGTEIGEAEPSKAVEKIRKLKSELAEHETRAANEKKARIDGEIDTVMKDFEKDGKITPFERDEIFVPALRAELEKGTKLKETKVFKALSERSVNGITGQRSKSDDGSKLPDDPDAKLQALANKHLAEDDDLKELKTKDFERAMDMAQDRAAKEMKYVSPQLKAIKDRG